MIKPFIYFAQGKKNNLFKYHPLQTNKSDLVLLTYDEPIYAYEIKCKYVIYYPNSTWAAGRNRQLREVNNLEDYKYFIFLDDDVEFVKGSFAEFEALLLRYCPAIGVPLFPIVKKYNNYKKHLNIQHPVTMDQQLQAFHREVIKAGVVMPLETKFDEMSWWYACEINTYLSITTYRGYIMQFNTIEVNNSNHIWSKEFNRPLDDTSNYKGGISQEGLKLIKKFIIEKYGPQKHLTNSLFHDDKFPRYTAFSPFPFFLKQLLYNILKGKFKYILQLISQWFSNYKLKKSTIDMINIHDFKSFC